MLSQQKISAVGAEAFAVVEDRHQVELVLRHRAGGRLQGQHLRHLIGLVLRLEQVGTGLAGVIEQLLQVVGLAHEHHR